MIVVQLVSIVGHEILDRKLERSLLNYKLGAVMRIIGVQTLRASV